MNTTVRNIINDIAKKVELFCSNIFSTIVSFMRMFVLSRISVAHRASHYSELKQHDNCTILANGPSLKDAFDNREVILDNVDIFCVNMFAQWELFWNIKPRFYFLSDGQFFNPTEDRCRQQVEVLIDAFNRIEWEMYLCIPAGCFNGGILKQINNNHIKILRWNTTTFEGFDCICHFLFKRNLAMPRCQTVTNAALMAAINLSYKNVYLYGADHSWTKDLRVDDNNIVCYGDRHVYDTSLSEIKLDYSIATLLIDYANMFKSHIAIQKYSNKMGVKIWNCTKNSFIDAYKRM